MAITNFMSTVWSENLLQKLEKQYIAIAHCNRDYEGEIRDKGSVVRICGLESILVSNYVKNTTIDTPKVLNEKIRDLCIDQARCFNFMIEDVDRAQASPRLMES